MKSTALITIKSMDVIDLEVIKDTLFTDFDDFWNYNIFKQELENENSKYIIAKSGEETVGFAGIWICIDEAHITNIVTKKCYRENGIATKLLDSLISLSQKLGLTSITLEVNENNLPAISLYKKFEFNQVGLRTKYYNNKDNAIIMTKLL